MKRFVVTFLLSSGSFFAAEEAQKVVESTDSVDVVHAFKARVEIQRLQYQRDVYEEESEFTSQKQAAYLDKIKQKKIKQSVA